MRKISYDEIKSIQLEILIDVATFCKKYGIKYSLAYGTLIGAIRHKGYIPWDDDIDIMMPREDYNRFLDLFNNEYSHLSVIAPELNDNFYAPYANVFNNRTLLKEIGISHRNVNIGVKIDIFPMDFVANDLNKYNEQLLETVKLNYRMLIKRHLVVAAIKNSFKNGLKIFIKKILYSFFSYKKMQQRIRQISLEYSNTDFVDNIVFRVTSTQQSRIPKSILEEYEVASFEGYEFQIIKNFDTYLFPIYGNYMQLPPIEEQIPSHGFEAYWI